MRSLFCDEKIVYDHTVQFDDLMKLRHHLTKAFKDKRADEAARGMPEDLRAKAYEFNLVTPGWRTPQNQQFRGWSQEYEKGLTAINVVEILLLQHRNIRFLEYALNAYVQVYRGEQGRVGSLNVQFGKWLYQVHQLAIKGSDGRMDSELERMIDIWERRKEDTTYIPDATMCMYPYKRGELCDWGVECYSWHEGPPRGR